MLNAVFRLNDEAFSNTLKHSLKYLTLTNTLKSPNRARSFSETLNLIQVPKLNSRTLLKNPFSPPIQQSHLIRRTNQIPRSSVSESGLLSGPPILSVRSHTMVTTESNQSASHAGAWTSMTLNTFEHSRESMVVRDLYHCAENNATVQLMLEGKNWKLGTDSGVEM
ncbi:hypothetical protein NPIL_670461 [Nephila pilipes]|uniref:Uncharacterized protein n=1 Tax=Nephila pilipes TaxID=299642 RepID=A0A8X6PG65_NEPPI|nr:hypothetical protein NPIL_670461 [Nephila pilipes]